MVPTSARVGRGFIVPDKGDLERICRSWRCASPEAISYALPYSLEHDSPYLSMVPLFCVGMVLLQCGTCLWICLSLEMWYDIESQDDVIVELARVVPHVGNLDALDDSSTPLLDRSGRIIRIKAVCHPRWFLDYEQQTLTQLLQRMQYPEFEVISEPRASIAGPHGPLSRYEAVVRLIDGVSREEVGRIMQSLLERRRVECGIEAAPRARAARFQLVASSEHTFLHFGGSIACGRIRWRSCPARIAVNTFTWRAA